MEGCVYGMNLPVEWPTEWPHARCYNGLRLPPNVTRVQAT